MEAHLLLPEPTPSRGKRFPRWAAAALSSAATIVAYQALTPLTGIPQSSQQLFTLWKQPRWTLPNGETSLRQALQDIETQANNNSAMIERLQHPDCHPLQDTEFNLYVDGYGDNGGHLGMWLSFHSNGHWMVAGYPSEHSSMPLRFQRFPDQCNTYYLQNKYPHDYYFDSYLSFTSDGKWIRTIYNLASAMPVQFLEQDNGLYKMKVDYPGTNSYVSYTSGASDVHPVYSLRLDYNAQSAMTVSLHSP